MAKSILFWSKMLEHLQNNENTFLAIVAYASKHCPGQQGAKLFLSSSGKLHGTIGGGSMELHVCQLAQQALRQSSPSPPQLHTIKHRPTPPPASGLICAGYQKNLYYLATPKKDRDTVQKILHYSQNEIPAALYLHPQGLEVRQEECHFERPPLNFEEKDNQWLYREEILSRKRLAIVGGGHCALALSQLAYELGYLVTVFEKRKSLPTFEENTYAQHKHRLQRYHQAPSLIPFPSLTFLVIMTNSYQDDIEALQALLPLPFPFIGLMGSRFKIQAVFEQLRQNGVSPQALEKIHAPVGIPLQSHTPWEIAVSVCAQILQKRPKWISV